MPQIDFTSELTYIILLFGLFVVPRMLQGIGLPTAITSFALGGALGLGLGLFQHDPTVTLLSTLGIVALFLFAGLEVNLQELRGGSRVLVLHVINGVVLYAAATWLLWRFLGLELRPAILVALALLTPSTGFILDSLNSVTKDAQERFWIRSKAVATEIVALLALFFTLRSTSVMDFTVSTLALVLMIAVLPWLFRGFAKLVLPYAPKSDFAFLVIVAVACALVTRNLGVYYLVGAFVVGMVAQQYRHYMPSLQSDHMLHAVEALGSLFIPFYFFHAGLELHRDDFSLAAIGTGIGFTVAILPFRIIAVSAHRKFALKERFAQTLRISVRILPTLVFTLVLAAILREQYDIPSWLFGGLIVYAFLNTVLPSLFKLAPPPEYTMPPVVSPAHLPPEPRPTVAGTQKP